LIVIVDVYNRYLYSVVGDGLYYHHGEKFSTRDQDNDAYSGNCAEECHGAWWYINEICADVNLNGMYRRHGVHSYIYNYWDGFKDRWESLKDTIMMVRPKT
jgi:hypothetical protein